MAPAVVVPCISRAEAFAEKIRAALTRREVAIRDFYDLDHATRTMGLQPTDAELVALVRQKLAVPGNPAVDMGPERLVDLRRQVDGRLRPVLRASDFDRIVTDVLGDAVKDD